MGRDREVVGWVETNASVALIIQSLAPDCSQHFWFRRLVVFVDNDKFPKLIARALHSISQVSIDKNENKKLIQDSRQ